MERWDDGSGSGRAKKIAHSQGTANQQLAVSYAVFLSPGLRVSAK